MKDAEKITILRKAVEVIEEEFDTEKCGKHSSVTLSCISCQASIVRGWLLDVLDLYIFFDGKEEKST